MDPAALAAANALLGNPEDAAAIEMTLVGADLEALADANVCLEGAAPQVEHEGRAVRVGERIHLHAGDRLRVARILGGARTYLCVEGGLAQPQRPQISPRLASGDLLYGSPLPLTHSPSRPVPSSPRVPASPRPRVEGRSHSETRETVVRVVLDPRQGPFSKEGIATFLSAVYRISSSSDRRGIRLEGTPVALAEAPDISPEGTPLGGIQVARDGMPIVLGPDRPITGGYARIATVIRADFPLLAQAASGAAVRFAPVALAEALRARIG